MIFNLDPNNKKNNVILHVGFAHSGTTSLQENLFSTKEEFYYCGLPYNEFGGIFSEIKYQSEKLFDYEQVELWCKNYILDKVKPNQIIVVSDESLTEQVEVYYTPPMQSTSLIAKRLCHFFPNAKILFTIRNQFDYVQSCYLNLKRNYAMLAKRSIEDFNSWFAGNHSQVTNLFLRNLDYSSAIIDYINIFGEDSVCVIPLEMLSRKGAKEYLSYIAEYFGFNVDNEDIEQFSKIRNKRLLEQENKILDMWISDNFNEEYQSYYLRFSEIYMNSENSNKPLQINLDKHQINLIYQKSAKGNKYLVENFALSLHEYSYPLPI